WRCGSVRAPKQRIAACCHRTASALSSAGLATKSQGEITKRCIQADSALGSGSNETRQALGEGDGRASWIDASKAAYMQEQASASLCNGKVSGMSGRVTMNARGAGRAIRTSCSVGGWRHSERNGLRLNLNVQNRHVWRERCQPPPAS